MPPAARARTATLDKTRESHPTTGSTTDEKSPRTGADSPAGTDRAPVVSEASEGTETETREDAGLVNTIVRGATLPFTAAKAVADDITSTAHRPDAVLYRGGLAGLTALGVLEWPVAAAVGVGVAVANGRRRSRVGCADRAALAAVWSLLPSPGRPSSRDRQTARLARMVGTAEGPTRSPGPARRSPRRRHVPALRPAPGW